MHQTVIPKPLILQSETDANFHHRSVQHLYFSWPRHLPWRSPGKKHSRVHHVHHREPGHGVSLRDHAQLFERKTCVFEGSRKLIIWFLAILFVKVCDWASYSGSVSDSLWVHCLLCYGVAAFIWTLHILHFDPQLLHASGNFIRILCWMRFQRLLISISRYRNRC